MNGHPLDDLAAFSIGALDAGEARTVRAHLDRCESCRSEVSSFAEVSWGIAELATAVPKADLRERVVARAVRAPARGDPLGFLRRALAVRVPATVPLALALVLALAVAGLESARSEAAGYARAVAGVVDAKIVALAPAAAGGPRGTLVVPRSGDPYLILQLPDPPAGKTWAAWVVRDGQALAAGLTGGRSGVVTLALTRPVQTGDELALTLEDAGGVPVPRGAMVLRGRI